MDMLRNEVRNLSYNEFSETKSLEHASQQARAQIKGEESAGVIQVQSVAAAK